MKILAEVPDMKGNMLIKRSFKKKEKKDIVFSEVQIASQAMVKMSLSALLIS